VTVMSDEIGKAEVGPDVPWIHTSLGSMRLPMCAFTFLREANRVRKARHRSRLVKKAMRYRTYVDNFAVKQYQAGAVFNQITAPTWGEFDLHDMATH
jgi:hypothetical protein